MIPANDDQDPALSGLARELWDAHATNHEVALPLSVLCWDELDTFAQDHWRVIARTALAFGPPMLSTNQREDDKAADLLAAVLSHADFERATERLTYASLAIPPALLDEAFAVVGARRD